MADLALSRRALVAGAAVSAFAGPAVAAPNPDAVLLDLERRLDAAEEASVAAGEALAAAFDRVVYPEPPAALFFRPTDDEIGVLQPTFSRGGRRWYGDEVDLVSRAKPRRARCGPEGFTLGFEPDPAGVTRVAEIMAADRAWRADKAAAYQAGGVPAADAANGAAGWEVRRLMGEMSAVPALALAGVLVKARAVALAFGGADALAEEISEEPDSTAETMALVIVRDLLRLAGSGALPAA